MPIDLIRKLINDIPNASLFLLYIYLKIGNYRFNLLNNSWSCAIKSPIKFLQLSQSSPDILWFFEILSPNSFDDNFFFRIGKIFTCFKFFSIVCVELKKDIHILLIRIRLKDFLQFTHSLQNYYNKNHTSRQIYRRKYPFCIIFLNYLKGGIITSIDIF